MKRTGLYKRLSLLRGDADEIPAFTTLMSRALTQHQGDCRAWSILRKWNLTSTSCHFAFAPIATAFTDDEEALADDFTAEELDYLRTFLNVMGTYAQTPSGQGMDEGMEDALDDSLVKSKSKSQWIDLCLELKPTHIKLPPKWPPVSWSRRQLIVWLQNNTTWEGGERVAFQTQVYRRLHRSWFAKSAQSRAMSRGIRNEARALDWVIAMLGTPLAATTDALQQAFDSPNIKISNAFHVGLVRSKDNHRTCASPDAIIVFEPPTGSKITVVWECKTRSGLEVTQRRQALKADESIDTLVYVDLDDKDDVSLFQRVIVSEANRMQVIHLATVVDVDFVLFTECTTRDLIYSVLIRCSPDLRKAMTHGFLQPLHRIVVSPLIDYLSQSALTSFTSEACTKFGFPVGEAGTEEAYYVTFALQTALLQLAESLRKDADVPLPRCLGLKSMAVSQWDTFMGAVDINTQLANSLSKAFVRVGMYHRLWSTSLATCLVSIHKVRQITGAVGELGPTERLSDRYPTMRLLRAALAKKATLLQTAMELYKHVDCGLTTADRVNHPSKPITRQSDNDLAQLLGPTSNSRPRLHDESWNSTLRDARTDTEHTAIPFTQIKVNKSTGLAQSKAVQRMCRAPGCCSRCRTPVPSDVGSHFHPEVEYGFVAFPERIKVTRGCLECGSAYAQCSTTTDATIAFPLCTQKGRWNIETYTAKGWQVTQRGVSCWDAHHSGVMYPSDMVCCVLPEHQHATKPRAGRPSNNATPYTVGAQRLQRMMKAASTFSMDSWNKAVAKAAARKPPSSRPRDSRSGQFNVAYSKPSEASADSSASTSIPTVRTAVNADTKVINKLKGKSARATPNPSPVQTTPSLQAKPAHLLPVRTTPSRQAKRTHLLPVRTPPPRQAKRANLISVEASHQSGHNQSKRARVNDQQSERNESNNQRPSSVVSSSSSRRVTRQQEIDAEAAAFIKKAAYKAVSETAGVNQFKTVHRAGRRAVDQLNEVVDNINKVSTKPLPRMGLRSGSKQYDMTQANFLFMSMSDFDVPSAKHPTWFDKDRFIIKATVTDHFPPRSLAKTIVKWLKALGGEVTVDFNHNQIGTTCGYLAADAAITGIGVAPEPQSLTCSAINKIGTRAEFLEYNTQTVRKFNPILEWDEDYNSYGENWLNETQIHTIVYETCKSDLITSFKAGDAEVPGDSVLSTLAAHKTSLLSVVAVDALPVAIVNTFKGARDKGLAKADAAPQNASVIKCFVANTSTGDSSGVHWISVNLFVKYQTSDTSDDVTDIISP
jgi:hypothetical protein